MTNYLFETTKVRMYVIRIMFLGRCTCLCVFYICSVCL